jgi:hypothetical protein
MLRLQASPYRKCRVSPKGRADGPKGIQLAKVAKFKNVLSD